MRGWSLSLTVLVCLALATASAPAQDPTNASGLRGRTLTRVAAVGGGSLADVAGAFLGGGSKPDAEDLLRGLGQGKQKGSIDSVRVIEDRDRSLLLEVAFSAADVSSPKVMSAEVRAAKGKLRVNGEPVPLSAAAGTLQLRLDLDPSFPEGTSVESKSLVVRIGTSATAVQHDAITSFELPKRWTVSVRPENVVVEVTPAPVGTIPASDPTAGAPPPKPAIFRPEIATILIAPLAIHMVPKSPPPSEVKPESPRMRVMANPVMATTAATAAPVAASPAAAATSGPAARMINPAVLANIRALPPPAQNAGVPQAVKDKGGRGPSNERYPIFTTLQTEAGIQLTPDRLTNIHPDLYRDANADAGIFYYLPAAFNLYWDKDNGYALRIVYGASGGDTAANVAVAARLTSGIDSADLDLLRRLLGAALGTSFKELRPLPYAGSAAIAFRELGQYNIPPEKISVTGLSHIGGDVDLAFTTDSVTKDNIEAALTQGLGVNGSASFSAAVEGSSPFSVDVPMRVRITSPETFGTVFWHPGMTMRNDTPFPMRLKYLHFLTIGRAGVPTVYSYDLNQSLVQPQARAHFADTPVPQWIQDHALRGWVEYGLVSDYPPGTEQARRTWTRGAEISAGRLAIASLTPFADVTGLGRIVVDIRSRYFDTRGESEETKSVTLNADNQTINVTPFYRTTDAGSGEGPLFQFRLTVIKSDGTVNGPGPWTSAATSDLYVGSAQVRPLLPAHP